jgi:hypothetical protein
MIGAIKFHGVDLLIVELVPIWNDMAHVQIPTMKPRQLLLSFRVRNADTCCLKFTDHIQATE